MVSRLENMGRKCDREGRGAPSGSPHIGGGFLDFAIERLWGLLYCGEERVKRKAARVVESTQD